MVITCGDYVLLTATLRGWYVGELALAVAIGAMVDACGRVIVCKVQGGYSSQGCLYITRIAMINTHNTCDAATQYVVLNKYEIEPRLNQDDQTQNFASAAKQVQRHRFTGSSGTPAAAGQRLLLHWPLTSRSLKPQLVDQGHRRADWWVIIGYGWIWDQGECECEKERMRDQVRISFPLILFATYLI